MFESLTNKLAEFFTSLSLGRKISVVAITLLIVGGIASLFIWASKANYVNLAGNLSSVDSTAVIRYLREKKIPFKVDASGKAILVPDDFVYDLRLELASKGLAQTSVVGYEVFDTQNFGTTNTVQEVNRKRALEGELVRTINHIKGVERSRVHLAIPKKSAFLESSENPTASVVVDLTPGFKLAEKQIEGIQTLVSSSIEGLNSGQVTVLSTSGAKLSKNVDDPNALFAQASLEYKATYEKELEDKVKLLLERAVGEGKVIAKVTADLDFSRVRKAETKYDADNATARSKNTNKDSMLGKRPTPDGTPGAATQVPGADGQAITQQASVSNETQRSKEVVNFEIPQTNIQTEKPFATLNQLSVAVMVDGQYVTEGEGDEAKKVFKAWDAAKLDEFKAIVASAIGWKKDRDTPIEIKTMQFFQEDVEKATEAAAIQERNKTIGIAIGWVIVGLIFTLFFLLVVRPFIKWVTENTIDNVEDFLPQTLEELEKAQVEQQVLPGMDDLLPELEERVDPLKVQSEMMKDKILTLVNDHPLKAAQILHEWLIQEKEEEEEAEQNNA